MVLRNIADFDCASLSKNMLRVNASENFRLLPTSAVIKGILKHTSDATHVFFLVHCHLNNATNTTLKHTTFSLHSNELNIIYNSYTLTTCGLNEQNICNCRAFEGSLANYFV
jgi:hypothetical protein